MNKTKEKISAVLVYFGGIKISENFGIEVKEEVEVNLGDVYAKFDLDSIDMSKGHKYIKLHQALYKWWKLGASKSLNKIFSEKKIPAQEADCSNCLKNCSQCKKEVFKDPKIQDLLEFLYNLTEEK